MLEGKEIDLPIGSMGRFVLDINEKGVMDVGATIRVDLVTEAVKLANKHPENKALGFVKKILMKTKMYESNDKAQLAVAEANIGQVSSDDKV